MEELEGTSFGKLKAMIDGAADDYVKALSGNKSAGVRVRGILQDAKLLAHSIKKELLAVRKKKD
jgi:hypothetical protein